MNFEKFQIGLATASAMTASCKAAEITGAIFVTDGYNAAHSATRTDIGASA